MKRKEIEVTVRFKSKNKKKTNAIEEALHARQIAEMFVKYLNAYGIQGDDDIIQVVIEEVFR